MISLAIALCTFAALSLVNHSEGLRLNLRWLLGVTIIATLTLGGTGIVTTAWSVALVAVLLAITITDLKTQLLPDWLTGLLIILGLAQAGFAFPSLLGAIICILCALANATITKDEGMIGSADYLLCAGLVAWLGPLHAMDALIIALVLFGLQLILTGRRLAAFAPATSIGLSAIWFGGPFL